MRIEVTPKDAYRLDWYVDSSGGPGKCWPWTGYCDALGYGIMHIQGTTQKAHRVAFAANSGRWPGLHVLHSCDNRACCNPQHLSEGTHSDNMLDMYRKGRHVINRGSLHKNAILTESQVALIKALYRTGDFTHRSLAARFKVSEVTVFRIVNRKTWSHVS